jgi:hypothetical protein
MTSDTFQSSARAKAITEYSPEFDEGMLLHSVQTDNANQFKDTHLREIEAKADRASGIIENETHKVFIRSNYEVLTKSYFIPKVSWEGEVLEVKENSFTSSLVPTVNDGEEKFAEVLTEEISMDERDLIQKGAIFYWSIGYSFTPQGRMNSSYIRFRRPQKWSKRHWNFAKKFVERMKSLFA